MTRKTSWAVVSIVGAVLVVAALRTFLAAHDRPAISTTSVSEASTDQPQNPPSIMKVSAADLYAAYDVNAVAANDEFSGRRLEVSGVVFGKGEPARAGVHLRLKVDQAGMETVDVMLKPQQTRAASALRNGDAVIVDCPHVQRDMGELILKDCALFSAENQSTGE